jgi:hypothetical protein
MADTGGDMTRIGDSLNRCHASDLQIGRGLGAHATRAALIGAAWALTVAGCSSSSNTIEWDDGSASVGETPTVCGPLASAHGDTTSTGGDVTFINLGYNYPDDRRFQFIGWERDAGLVDLLNENVGVTVCASGQIHLYEGVGEIELGSLKDVSVPEWEQDQGPDPYWLDKRRQAEGPLTRRRTLAAHAE